MAYSGLLRSATDGAQAVGPPHAHRPGQLVAAQLGQAGQLRHAAGQHHAGRQQPVIAAAFHLAQDQVNDFLGPRVDDLCQQTPVDDLLAVFAEAAGAHLTVDGTSSGRAWPNCLISASALLVGHAQAGGHVAHEVVAADVQHVGVIGRRFQVDRQVGRAAADVDQRDAGLTLFIGQHRLGRGQRLEHEVFDLQAVVVDAVHQVGDGRGRAGDDAGIHFQPIAEHADRVQDALLIIHGVGAGDRIDDFPVVGQGDVAGLLHRPLGVIGRDLAAIAADRHDALAADGRDVRARDAHVGGVHRDTGRGLGLLDRQADGRGGVCRVDDNPAPQALGVGAAHAGHAQLVVLVERADQGTDFGGAHIQGADHLAHASSLPPERLAGAVTQINHRRSLAARRDLAPGGLEQGQFRHDPVIAHPHGPPFRRAEIEPLELAVRKLHLIGERLAGTR